ncbi:MAG TPA: hypothetical protein ENN34_12820 [Deltaproteobacteria bacterium]|nr:hypothetical protein [Deltaproteobacteria bacterium]
MTREEFESALREFEIQVRKRLPSMINIYLVNKGNREQATAFSFLIETLNRQKKALLKDLSKVARPAQKTRFFNVVHNMDSQLRSMNNKEALQQQLKLRRRRIHTPATYDIGSGPEQGNILNVSEDAVLLETKEKISADHEIRLTVSGKNAKGKAIWSIEDPGGEVETGVKLTQISEEFIDEIKKLID